MSEIPSDLCTGLPVFLTLPDSPSPSLNQANPTATSPNSITPHEQEPLREFEQGEEELDPIPALIRRSLASLQPLTPLNPESRRWILPQIPSALSELSSASRSRFTGSISRVTEQIVSAKVGIEGFISGASRGSERRGSTRQESDSEGNDGALWVKRWISSSGTQDVKRPRAVTRRLSEEAVAGVDATEDWIEIVTGTQD